MELMSKKSPSTKGIDQVDMLYYINLDKREDRLLYLESNVLPYIDLPSNKKTRVSAVDHTNFSHISQRGAGCSLSHIKVWKDAIDKGYTRIIVMEDDFTLLEEKDDFNRVIQDLNTIEFSICNLGYNNRSPLIETNDKGFYRCTNIQTTSCYVADVRFLKLMLPHIEEATARLMNCESYHANAIDQVWKKFQTRKDWLVSKRVGKQRASHSDIEKRNTNYGV